MDICDHGQCSRYKLEHNQISRSEVDKADIFDILNIHLQDPDPEIQHTALQLIQVRNDLLHKGKDQDNPQSCLHPLNLFAGAPMVDNWSSAS